MRTLCTLMLVSLVPSWLTSAQESVALPKDVPPVVATAITPSDSEKWVVQLTIPKVTWKLVGAVRPKIEWPEIQVDVEETVLTLSLDYPRETALSDAAQNRIVDLKGRRLNRDEAERRLKDKTPVLVSVSGRIPDAFYLQCSRPDTLIVILGLGDSPAPRFLPHEADEEGRTMR